MRVIFLLDEYLPNSTRSHAKMLHELAKEFLSRGHSVVVVTPGTVNQVGLLDVEYLDGVEIWRFKSKPTRGGSNFQRAIAESWLSINAFLATQKRIRMEPFDLCINHSPTIFFGPFAFFLKLKGAYVYLILRDFFPQWIIDEGIISKNGLPAIFFRFFEKINYKVSDCIALQSHANLTVFKKICKRHRNIDVLMNWADPADDGDSTPSLNLRKKLSLEGKIIFFYGGNIGRAQDIENLLRLSKSIAFHEECAFLFVGQGDQYEFVKKYIEKYQLSNVKILPSVSQNDYKKILSEVDVGMFSLSSKHTAHNFPGKLYGYMNKSLPILGSVNEGNDVLDIINQSGSGLVSINGNDQKLLDNALNMMNDSNTRMKMGKLSNNLLRDFFSVQSAADNILSHFYNRK